MANVTVASNATRDGGKWVPYYYKPFLLGVLATGVGSTDGGIYITQTVGTSAEYFYGSCTSDHNCGYYYILEFVNTYNFHVLKYDLGDNLVDTIYASATSGNGRYWRGKDTSTSNFKTYTIDIGVNVYIPDFNGQDASDKYKITLPTAEQMNKRRIYHGGYSTFMRMPYAENIAFNSDIIPTNLKNKNITAIFNPPVGAATGTKPQELALALSHADAGGNQAVSANITFNIDSTGIHDSEADAGSAWSWANTETWGLGTTLAADLDPHTATGEDFPAIGTAPSSDVTSQSVSTGTGQTHQLTCSVKGGYTKIRLSYESGDGSEAVTAHNQFWSIILMIN